MIARRLQSRDKLALACHALRGRNKLKLKSNRKVSRERRIIPVHVPQQFGLNIGRLSDIDPFLVIKECINA